MMPFMNGHVDVECACLTAAWCAGLNTVDMLKVASSALGMGPQHAMQTAERLYTSGAVPLT